MQDLRKTFVVSCFHVSALEGSGLNSNIAHSSVPDNGPSTPNADAPRLQDRQSRSGLGAGQAERLHTLAAQSVLKASRLVVACIRQPCGTKRQPTGPTEEASAVMRDASPCLRGWGSGVGGRPTAGTRTLFRGCCLPHRRLRAPLVWVARSPPMKQGDGSKNVTLMGTIIVTVHPHSVRVFIITARAVVG